MASKYGIMTVTTLNNEVSYDITSATEGSVREYSDAFIEAIITWAEQLIFGLIKTTYTTLTIPDDIEVAIKTMARIRMMNQLIRDNKIEGDIIDELEYFNTQIKDSIATEQAEGVYFQAQTIQDYEYSA